MDRANHSYDELTFAGEDGRAPPAKKTKQDVSASQQQGPVQHWKKEIIREQQEMSTRFTDSLIDSVQADTIAKMLDKIQVLTNQLENNLDPNEIMNRRIELQKRRLQYLLLSGYLSDVRFVFSNEGGQIFAHRAILSQKSSVFKLMFKQLQQEQMTNASNSFKASACEFHQEEPTLMRKTTLSFMAEESRKSIDCDGDFDYIPNEPQPDNQTAKLGKIKDDKKRGNSLPRPIIVFARAEKIPRIPEIEMRVWEWYHEKKQDFKKICKSRKTKFSLKWSNNNALTEENSSTEFTPEFLDLFSDSSGEIQLAISQEQEELSLYSLPTQTGSSFSSDHSRCRVIKHGDWTSRTESNIYSKTSLSMYSSECQHRCHEKRSSAPDLTRYESDSDTATPVVAHQLLFQNEQLKNQMRGIEHEMLNSCTREVLEKVVYFLKSGHNKKQAVLHYVNQLESKIRKVNSNLKVEKTAFS
ncbi:hypothetical protein Ciccas_002716 [Cichlidogyrus casuarinus]|uniref:BTB domain-containing protein n=1 Tax=Cichlidogyrus casuarinus TaxID=1844966 RepID=A0ABD2QIR8_9PLAT